MNDMGCGQHIIGDIVRLDSGCTVPGRTGTRPTGVGRYHSGAALNSRRDGLLPALRWSPP